MAQTWGETAYESNSVAAAEFLETMDKVVGSMAGAEGTMANDVKLVEADCCAQLDKMTTPQDYILASWSSLLFIHRFFNPDYNYRGAWVAAAWLAQLPRHIVE